MRGNNIFMAIFEGLTKIRDKQEMLQIKGWVRKDHSNFKFRANSICVQLRPIKFEAFDTDEQRDWCSR